jgi:hypothetical protein
MLNNTADAHLRVHKPRQAMQYATNYSEKEDLRVAKKQLQQSAYLPARYEFQ